MPYNTNDINEEKQSTIHVIDHDDDDEIKPSEPASDAIEVIANEAHRTVTKAHQAAENTPPSNLNSIDLITTTTTTTTVQRSLIEEISPTITSTTVKPCTGPPPTDQIQSQINVLTTGNNSPESEKTKHIMISYNQRTATDICKKIYDHLTAKGYRVWFDRNNLTDGSILDAMGEAVDNAYVVLLCMNEGYSNSRYASLEAKYALEWNVPVIPCMVEKDYRPRGGLGIIKCDRKHIEFFDETKFDENFEELTRQIDIIASRSNITSIVGNNDMNFRDRFNTILTEHIESIRTLHLRQGNRNEMELNTILRRLIQEFSPETLQSFQNHPSNDVRTEQIQEECNNSLLQHLFQMNERLEEHVRIQQNNNARLEQRIIEQDGRLAALELFQREQQQEEQNDRTLGQIVQRIDRLAELVINQQQEQQQTSYLNSDLLKTAINATVLLCTLYVLFKER